MNEEKKREEAAAAAAEDEKEIEIEVTDAPAEEEKAEEAQGEEAEATIDQWREALELAVKQRDEYLDSLRAKGIPMCVASATGKPLVELCLETLGLKDYFSFILSCVEVGAGKNRPDVFLEAARRLGAEPTDCAVFEDAIYAVRSAKEAGFYVVAVKDAHNDSCWEELQSLADETITTWL